MDSEDDQVIADQPEDAEPVDLPDEEMTPGGARAPIGWTVHTFGARQASVPPWSRTPPDCTPEVWVLANRKEGEAARAKWKLQNLVSYNAQEARRAAYVANKLAKMSAAVIKVAEAEDVQQQLGTPGTPIVDNTPDDKNCVAQSSQRQLKEKESNRLEPVERVEVPVNGDSVAQRKSQRGAIEQFKRHATEKLHSRRYDNLVLEICCKEDSELSRNVGRRSLAIRVTENLDLTDKDTTRALHAITRTAKHMSMAVHIWVSIPCTAGCRWKRINAAKGIVTGDMPLTKKMVAVAIGLGEHTVTSGGHVHWEWPSTCDLWNGKDVHEFLGRGKLRQMQLM